MEKQQIEVERRTVYVDEDGVPDYRRNKQIVRDTDLERRVGVNRIAQFIWLLFGLLNMLLLFRFVMKLIGANPESGFAEFIYSASGVFLVPFEGLLEAWTSGNMIVEFSTLVAIVVYSIVAWVLVRLVWLLLYHPGKRIVQTYEEEYD